MQCHKCNNKIPTRITFNNCTRKVSSRRKFCFECSPFGLHNTKQDDPSRPSIKSNLKYSLFSPEQKAKHIARTSKRGHDLKRKYVEQKGGKCEKCGYCKCLAALHFHHRDPKEKSFSLSVVEIRSRETSLVEQEVAKCDLICANCHAEEHFTF